MNHAFEVVPIQAFPSYSVIVLPSRPQWRSEWLAPGTTVVEKVKSNSVGVNHMGSVVN